VSSELDLQQTSEFHDFAGSWRWVFTNSRLRSFICSRFQIIACSRLWRLRRFKILDLHTFVTSELHGFKIPDLRTFATSELCRFKIPDLREFCVPENPLHEFHISRRFEGDKFF
jgi:hypothetical protein